MAPICPRREIPRVGLGPGSGLNYKVLMESVTFRGTQVQKNQVLMMFEKLKTAIEFNNYYHSNYATPIVKGRKMYIRFSRHQTVTAQNSQVSNILLITLESQESFLVQRARRAAEVIVSQNAGDFSQARQTLMELIHPAHMGQRFQVLWGLRKG